ncbi:MAG TPA: hypothetical protein VNH13_01670 [Candidatus Acidoferrales bacterium]|nr:hypothetical protein [Candidatus Acidoferrales bacterium]
MRRKKVVYPPAKTATQSASQIAAGDLRQPGAGRTVSINLDAMTGKKAIRQGDRVRISSGLYGGEVATVESLVGGVIPAALVRTDAGRTRRMRTIDLIPYDGKGPEAAPPTAEDGPTA